MRLISRIAVIGVLAAVGIAGSANDAAAPECRPAHETLHGLLWMQTAAEYQISATSAYRLARIQLDRALADKDWTAMPEDGQAAGAVGAKKRASRRKPPAVILDIDETVLDNSPMQASLAREARNFTSQVWSEWVALEAAGAVPGAVEFLQYARRRGVTVFFVSGRTKEQEEATRRNLERVGVALDPRIDQVLTRNEREEWKADKSTRRAFVARSYRVLLLIGDDLADFVSVENQTLEERIRTALAHRDQWGTKWIQLPNPVYGSWEAATRNYRNAADAASDREILMRKMQRLRGMQSNSGGGEVDRR